LTLHNALGAGGNPVERVPYNGKIFATGVRQDEPLALAAEELDAERGLQRFDLVADGSLRDTELLGRSREAFAPRRSLESLKSVKRWENAAASSAFMRKSNPTLGKSG
jgi:hypothetical protein